MCRSGIASPGGYTSYTASSKIEELLVDSRREAERIGRLAELSQSLVSVGRRVGAAVQIDKSLALALVVIQKLEEAKTEHLDTHGAKPTRNCNRDPFPQNLGALLKRSRREIDECASTIGRAQGLHSAGVLEPSKARSVSTINGIHESLALVKNVRKCMILVKQELLATPGTVQALRFRRDYQGPVPMYLQSFS